LKTLRDLCVAGEKWLACGESKIFRISKNQTNLSISYIFKHYQGGHDEVVSPSTKKILSRGEAIFQSELYS